MANVYVSHSGSDTSPYDTEAKASDSIQDAIDVAVDGDTVWIKADSTYTLTAGITIDVANNIKIKGYYLTIGDQDFEGDYCKDASHGWAIIDSDNGLWNALQVWLFYDIVFENIKIINTYNASKSYSCIDTTDAVIMGGIVVRNCWLDGGGYGVSICDPMGLLIDDCKFTGTYFKNPKSLCDNGPVRVNRGTWGTIISNCTFEPTGALDQCIFSGGSSVITGCTFIIDNDATSVIRHDLNSIFIANNSIYSSGSDNGIYLSSDAISATIYNNIIQGVTTPINDDSGRNIYNDYNCYSGNSEAHGVSSDPDFVDAANGDFTPRNPNVLRGGKPDINGNFTPMGAIYVPQQFSAGKPFNPGRLSIIRN